MPRLFAQLARRFGPHSAHGVTRRTFLSTIGTATLPFVSGCHSAPKPPNSPPRRVLIIGAGLAGLACGDALRQAGHDVVIIEARPRIGGRIFTDRALLSGSTVEGGGEWIGAHHSHWLQLAKRFRLKLSAEDDDDHTRYFLAGRELNETEIRQLHVHLQVLQSSLEDLSSTIRSEDPWNSPDALKIDRQSLHDWLAKQPVPTLAKHAFRVEMENENAVPLEWQSLLGILTMIRSGGGREYWTTTEAHRCPEGVDRLVEALADSVGRERFQLSAPVSFIRQTEGTVLARDATGRVWQGHHLVLTVPPSTWRWIQFDPPFPSAFLPPMGSASKYLVSYPTSSARSLALERAVLSDGPVGNTWLSPAVSAADHRVLTGFAGGPASEALRAEWSRTRETGVQAILSHFYPGFGPIAGHGKFMDWQEEPFSRGAYSFPPPGAITTYGEDLYRGAARIHFAGEYASYRFPGYMEGALESGYRVAAQISSAG